MLTLASLSMQSPTAMEAGDANDIVAEGEGFTFPAYAQNPVGTGPYKFDEYDEANGTVTLEANDDYWGDAPKSAELVFRVIPDESTRRQELEAGSIDGYDLPNPADWPGLEESGNSVEVRDPFNIFYLGLNPEANPKLKDLKVRQALYYALDREQLVQTQLPEGAEVATQFMPSTVSGYNSDARAVRLRPGAGQAAAPGGRRRGHDPEVRLPDRGQPALHAGPAAALRGAARPTSRTSASRSRSRRRPGTAATSTT